MEMETDDAVNWCTVSDDVWIRILHNLEAFSALDVARFVCVNKAFRRIGAKFLNTLETFQGSISKRKDVGVVLLWLLERCPKLVLMKAHVLADMGTLARPAARLLDLTRLELYGMKIKSEELRKLFFNKRTHWPTFPNLRSMVLRSMQLTGRSVKWLQPFAVPHLTSLTIIWCTSISADMIVDACFKLQQLSLRGCPLITDAITSHLHNVKELDLAFTSLTDKGLDALTYGCPSLRTLSLAHRHHNNWDSGLYTLAGFEKFSSKRPDVNIDLVHC